MTVLSVDDHGTKILSFFDVSSKKKSLKSLPLICKIPNSILLSLMQFLNFREILSFDKVSPLWHRCVTQIKSNKHRNIHFQRLSQLFALPKTLKSAPCFSGTCPDYSILNVLKKELEEYADELPEHAKMKTIKGVKFNWVLARIGNFIDIFENYAFFSDLSTITITTIKGTVIASINVYSALSEKENAEIEYALNEIEDITQRTKQKTHYITILACFPMENSGFIAITSGGLLTFWEGNNEKFSCKKYSLLLPCRIYPNEFTFFSPRIRTAYKVNNMLYLGIQFFEKTHFSYCDLSSSTWKCEITPFQLTYPYSQMTCSHGLYINGKLNQKKIPLTSKDRPHATISMCMDCTENLKIDFDKKLIGSDENFFCEFKDIDITNLNSIQINNQWVVKLFTGNNKSVLAKEVSFICIWDKQTKALKLTTPPIKKKHQREIFLKDDFLIDILVEEKSNPLRKSDLSIDICDLPSLIHFPKLSIKNCLAFMEDVFDIFILGSLVILEIRELRIQTDMEIRFQSKKSRLVTLKLNDLQLKKPESKCSIM